MWQWKVERHAKKRNALAAQYRVEVRKIGVLVERLKARDDAKFLDDQAIAWGNTALSELRQGVNDAESAWAAEDIYEMTKAVSRMRSARRLLERADAVPLHEAG
jgi:hypothetical protein